ncbi:transposase [Rhodovulum sulfidophilum]|uniref:Transposase n=1 Tax=Rhodovulum sulfidophilum TaxID=35806 RepID=A0A0D6B0T2_RHOSU|nr:transposase [Rhodovulum sulfidophilum]
MGQRRQKPEEIVAKLRQIDVLVSQGRSVAEAVRSIGVTQFTYYRWRKERALSAIGLRTMASAV